MSRIQKPLRGFTLVELLVVIAIIAMLVALLLPAIQAARAAARRTQCINNLKQIGLGLLNYAGAHGDELPQPYSEVRAPKHGWHIRVLPFLEYQAIHDNYDFDVDWSHKKNAQATKVDIPVFVCPSAPGGREGKWVTDYVVNDYIAPGAQARLRAAGLKDRPDWSNIFQIPHGPWFQQRPLRNTSRLVYCTDGLSKSFMIFEDAGRPMLWQNGRPGERQIGSSRWADMDNEIWTHDICGGGRQIFNCNNDNEVYGFHVNGAMFLYADGTVRHHTQDQDLDVHVSLFTRAGQDVVSSFD